MRKGDGVVHTFDILHGVDVDPDLNRSRTSLIVWFVDRKCEGSDARRVWLENRSDDVSQFVSGLASEVENGASAETLELYLSSASQGNIFALTALAQRHVGEQVVMVAHGGVLDVLYRLATRQDIQAPRTWQLANAAINRLLWTPDGLTLVGWADTQHLDQIVVRDENHA